MWSWEEKKVETIIFLTTSTVKEWGRPKQLLHVKQIFLIWFPSLSSYTENLDLSGRDDDIAISFEEVAKHHAFGSGQGKHTDQVPAKQNADRDAWVLVVDQSVPAISIPLFHMQILVASTQYV